MAKISKKKVVCDTLAKTIVSLLATRYPSREVIVSFYQHEVRGTVLSITFMDAGNEEFPNISSVEVAYFDQSADYIAQATGEWLGKQKTGIGILSLLADDELALLAYCI